MNDERINHQVRLLRGIPGKRKSDRVESWSRSINGKVYDFVIVEWAYGPIGSEVTVMKANTTTEVMHWKFGR